MGVGFTKKRKDGHRSHVNGVRRFMKVKGFRDTLDLDTQRLIAKYVKPSKQVSPMTAWSRERPREP